MFFYLYTADLTFENNDKGFIVTVDMKLTNIPEFQRLEKDLSKEWITYVDSVNEPLGWFEMSPEHTNRCYKLRDMQMAKTSAPCQTVRGGSMPTPNTFVDHWLMENKLSVHFEHNTRKMSVQHRISTSHVEQLEIPYNSIKEYVIVKPGRSSYQFFFSLKHSPLLSEEKTVKIKRISRDEENRLTELSCLPGEEIGPTSSICICIDTTHSDSNSDVAPEETASISTVEENPETNTQLPPNQQMNTEWEIISRLKKEGFTIWYASVNHQQPSFNHERIPVDLFTTFDQTYAFKCLLSSGFGVIDSLNDTMIMHLKDAQPSSDVLLQMASRSETVSFFQFQNELELAKKNVSNLQFELKDDIFTDIYTSTKRMVITPTNMIYLAPEPMMANRLVRQYKSEGFIRISFRDEDFCRLICPLAVQMEPVVKRFVQIMNDGFKIGNRHYEFLGCSSSQLREHGVWFFSGSKITADQIRAQAGELSHQRSVATYVSCLGLCFSSSLDTMQVAADTAHSVEFLNDIKRGKYCFTEGIGKISSSLAKKVIGLQCIINISS